MPWHGRLVRTWTAAVFAALVCFVSAASTLLARSPLPAEISALQARIDTFDKLMQERRYGELVDQMPPRLLETVARKGGVSLDQLRPLMRAQIDRVMQTGSIESFSMDLAKAEFRSLPNGDLYTLIPTTTRMTVTGLKATSRSTTLGLIDDGAWYLLRVSEAQIPILNEAYPAFAGVEFQKDSLEVDR